jgi:hypothetical protein
MNRREAGGEGGGALRQLGRDTEARAGFRGEVVGKPYLKDTLASF